MKIMYFMDNYTVLGGAAHTILRQAELMKIMGHIVIVMIDNSRTEICKSYIKFCDEKNIDMRFLPLSVSNQPEDVDIIYALEHYDEMKRVVMNVKPDILHSVQLNPLVELVARELNIPHVMNIYSISADFFKIDYMDIFPKYHICDSEYYADIWRKNINTHSVCIRTVADYAASCKPEQRLDKIIKCVCVGGVDEYKNQLSVIKACHQALKNGIQLRLNIYGNYEEHGYGEKCLTYIYENKLNEEIVLNGFCENMSEQYSKSDVLICASMLESYPNVISEALAYGLVIISTPVAGVPEVIEDKKNGYLCRGYTADDIYEKIIELNEDIIRGAIWKIRQNAYMTYEAVHSPKNIATKLEQYYYWLMENFEYKGRINIRHMRSMFSEIIYVYYKKIAGFSDEKRIGKKLWYLYHVKGKIEQQITEGKCFYIWGTGEYGKNAFELIEAYFPNMNMAGFVDSYKMGTYINIPIYEPSSILNNDRNIILVAALNGQDKILEELENRNRKYIKDYYILAPRHW